MKDHDSVCQRLERSIDSTFRLVALSHVFGRLVRGERGEEVRRRIDPLSGLLLSSWSCSSLFHVVNILFVIHLRAATSEGLPVT